MSPNVLLDLHSVAVTILKSHYSIVRTLLYLLSSDLKGNEINCTFQIFIQKNIIKSMSHFPSSLQLWRSLMSRENFPWNCILDTLKSDYSGVFKITHSFIFNKDCSLFERKILRLLQNCREQERKNECQFFNKFTLIKAYKN